MAGRPRFVDTWEEFCAAPWNPSHHQNIHTHSINKFCLAGSTAPVRGSSPPCFCPLKEHGGSVLCSAAWLTGEEGSMAREKKGENQAGGSAQHAAFPPAQLPAHLATSLLQAAFQALIFL